MGNNTAAVRSRGKSSNCDDNVKIELSVILPCYNRPVALKRTLNGLAKQDLAGKYFEIVVVDDASTADTLTVLEGFAKETKICFSFVVLSNNGGPARARNVALSMAQGDVILIIGDDIEPDPSLLGKHLRYHRENSTTEDALLGHVSFPEKLSTTPFMHWLEVDGRKYFFDYAELCSGEEAGPLFFYTCNVSVKAALLQKSGWFDESFPFASHEDLELGYRLAAEGMRLVYDETASGYHWHVLTIEGIAKRVYLMGYSADIFWQRVAESGSFSKRTLRNLITWGCSLFPLVRLWGYLRKKQFSANQSYPVQWKLLLFLGFFIGLSDGRKKKKIRV